MQRVIRKFGIGSVIAFALSAWLRAASAPVADAAMARDREAVKTLLKNGADVNAAQGDGMTALHWAARNGDAELTQMLLFAGANVKATTRLGGYTPLMMAAEQGHATVIAALLSGGADAKAANALGTTPLMLAAASGNPQAVTTLVENGAEIEAKEKTFGQTPLMFAAATNRVEAIKALIKAGANVKATSKVNNVGNLSGAEQEFLAAASGSGNQAGGNGTGPQRAGRGARVRTAPRRRGAGGGGGGGGGRSRRRRRQARHRSSVLLQRTDRHAGRPHRADARRAQRLCRRGEDCSSPRAPTSTRTASATRPARC